MGDLPPSPPKERSTEKGHASFREASVFRTQMPRPVGVGRHLVVVLISFAIALALAIFFAERHRGEVEDVPSFSPPP